MHKPETSYFSASTFSTFGWNYGNTGRLNSVTVPHLFYLTIIVLETSSLHLLSPLYSTMNKDPPLLLRTLPMKPDSLGPALLRATRLGLLYSPFCSADLSHTGHPTVPVDTDTQSTCLLSMPCVSSFLYFTALAADSHSSFRSLLKQLPRDTCKPPFKWSTRHFLACGLTSTSSQ